MHTEQDGDGCHHAAAQSENHAAGCVGAVRGSDGDVEIECIEDAGCTQERRQDREESLDPAARTALASAAAASSQIGGLICGLASVSPPLRAPHGQLHTLRRRTYQRSALVRCAVQIGGTRTPTQRICAVGKVSLGGQGWRADAVFSGGGQIVRCDGGTGRSWTQLPLLRLSCAWLLLEVVAGLMVARSGACSKRGTF